MRRLTLVLQIATLIVLVVIALGVMGLGSGLNAVRPTPWQGGMQSLPLTQPMPSCTTRCAPSTAAPLHIPHPEPTPFTVATPVHIPPPPPVYP
jgi:hypothetical protein